VARLT